MSPAQDFNLIPNQSAVSMRFRPRLTLRGAFQLQNAHAPPASGPRRLSCLRLAGLPMMSRRCTGVSGHQLPAIAFRRLPVSRAGEPVMNKNPAPHQFSQSLADAETRLRRVLESAGSRPRTNWRHFSACGNPPFPTPRDAAPSPRAAASMLILAISVAAVPLQHQGRQGRQVKTDALFLPT